MGERTLGEKVIRAISSGRVDEDLDVIFDALKSRMRYVHDKEALDLLRQIKPGDLVRINRNIKPKYLGGLEGVVASVDRSHNRRGLPMVAVDMGRPIRRYGRKILVPLGALEMVTPDYEDRGQGDLVPEVD